MVLNMNYYHELITRRQDLLRNLGAPFYAGAQSIRFKRPMLFTVIEEVRGGGSLIMATFTEIWAMKTKVTP